MRPFNIGRPTEPLGEDRVLVIHNGAMGILEEITTEFLNEEALGLFKQSGCTVNGTNARMGRDWLMEVLAQR